MNILQLAANAAGHPAWCGQGHHCQLGEHRAEPVTRRMPGLGTVVVTRIQTADGREHAEIRISVRLAAGSLARAHLVHLLRLLTIFTSRAALPD